MAARAPAPPPEAEGAETRYRCPKCRNEVALMLKSISVSCSRCGKVMKPLEKRHE